MRAISKNVILFIICALTVLAMAIPSTIKSDAFTPSYINGELTQDMSVNRRVTVLVGAGEAHDNYGVEFYFHNVANGGYYKHFISPQASDLVGYGKTNKRLNVYTIQMFLNKHMNAGLVTDGYFGQNTYNALKSFQSKYGLVADGIAGANTYNKMKEIGR